MSLASYGVDVNPDDFSFAVIMALTNKVRDVANALTKETGKDSIRALKKPSETLAQKNLRK